MDLRRLANHTEIQQNIKRQQNAISMNITNMVE